MRSALLVAALAASACGGGPPRAPNACTFEGGAPTDLAMESAPGLYAVGVIETSFIDDTRPTPAYGTYAGDTVRTLSTRITYPSDVGGNGADIASGGPFPVVLYSHGFSSTKGENTRLFAHLASHGYVVVAPSFPLSNIGAPDGPTGLDIADQPRDQTFLLDTLLARAAISGDPLEGGLDASRVAAVGLSLGGMTTLLLTYHATLRDPRVDVAVAMAPPGDLFGPAFYATTATPLLVIHGDADAVVEYDANAEVIFDRAQEPVSLLRLTLGTHVGFTGISALFDGQPGYENIDKLACDGLGAVTGGGSPASYSPYDLLGGAAAGLVVTSGDWNGCMNLAPLSMGSLRQLELTDAAVLAFLDAYLADDVARRSQACRFVERDVEREQDVVRYGR